jgi:A/G-specific adenine glycosylase
MTASDGPATAIDPVTVGRVRRAVLRWYRANHRDFPWRGTRDPYAVLVSEVMLQQTQADRVAPRFERFMARFPTAESLAVSPLADVLAEWSGLGYNRRALNLRRAAASVAVSGWPPDVAGLERLPGVGPYTARAVASLAFGLPIGVVDTNVRRWMIRRFDVADVRRDLQRASDRLASPGRGGAVAAWTHATMELGAMLCRPRRPRCAECPLARGCPARSAPRAVRAARQAPYAGSRRALRGAVLRLLAGQLTHAAVESVVRRSVGASHDAAIDDGTWSSVVDSLSRDGLAHRAGGRLHLGAGTIER